MADIEKVIKEAEKELEFLAPDDKHRLHMGIMMKLGWIYDVIALLKEQDAKEQISDDIHETAKQFRQTIVRCKDCKYVECEGVEGFLVCDLSGFSHSPEFFCADGERK